MDYPLAAGDPRQIGDYRIERKIGEGGMGTVFRGSTPGGRAVAVKVIKPELAADPEFRARFSAEVSAVRKVGGFHTAPVVDADPDAEQPWMASAFIAGSTLSRTIVEDGPFGEERLRALGAALAEALGAVHACGLVHRDLKPANIIMAVDGPRVLDFGIARAVDGTRLTHTGAVFGTAGFLAPEQIEAGAEVRGACDVFALGAVLVTASGGAAFHGETLMALLYSTVHQEPDLSTLPVALRPVVTECLDKNPSRRPTPAQLIARLHPDCRDDAPTRPLRGADTGAAERFGPSSTGPVAPPSRLRAMTAVEPPRVRDTAASQDSDSSTLTFTTHSGARGTGFIGLMWAVVFAIPVFVVLIVVKATLFAFLGTALIMFFAGRSMASVLWTERGLILGELGLLIAYRSSRVLVAWSDIVSAVPVEVSANRIVLHVTLAAGAPVPVSKGIVPERPTPGRPGSSFAILLPGVSASLGSAEGEMLRRQLHDAIRHFAPAAVRDRRG